MGRITNRRSTSPSRTQRPASRPQTMNQQRPQQAAQARATAGSKPAAPAQAAKPATPAAAAAPQDKATVSKPDAQGSTKESQAGAKSLIQNMQGFFGKAQDLAKKATSGVQLTPEEREQVKKASGTLDRLAGADQLWNQGDLKNNVSQLEKSGDLGRAVNSEIGNRVAGEKAKRGFIGDKLVDFHMNRNRGKYFNQGMQQARGMAKDQMAGGLDQGGVQRNAGHDAARAAKAGPEAARNAGKPISRAEMEQFQKAMDMLKARSKAQGMPDVKFPNGIPTSFLHDVSEGRNPLGSITEAGGKINFP